MKLETKAIKKNLLVDICGDIDHHSCEKIKQRVEEDFKKLNCRNIILDLNAVNFMDSSGIGMIIGRYKLAKSYGGLLVAVRVNSACRKIFEISGLLRLVAVFDSLEEALKGVDENVV